MKVNNIKKRKSLGFKENTNTKLPWKKVKLSGNLLSDDGGASLEGLLGLEVLESYKASSITKDKHPKIKRQKISRKPSNCEGSDESESEQSQGSKNQRKKKKKLEKNKRKKLLEKSHTNHEPGKFVRPLSASSSELVILKSDDLKTKIKSKIDEHETQNADINHSALTINDLNEWNGFGIAEPILRVLAEKGFREPTEIQSLTLPAAILGRRDILGAAETGSGKTLAFGIPIINGIMQLKKNPERVNYRKIAQHKSKKAKTVRNDENDEFAKEKWKKESNNYNRNHRDNLTPPPEEVNNFPDFADEEYVEPNHTQEERSELVSKPLYALILTPTRELAVQVKDHLVTAAKYTDIQIASIFGGLAAVKQKRILSKCPEIVVATPGRFWELVNEGDPHLNKFQNINFFVVDETDRMIEKGHFEELKPILERLNADPMKKAQRQNFIFSATLTLIHDLPQYLKLKNMNRKRKFKPETMEQKLESFIQYFEISQPKIIDITQTDHGVAKKLTECRISCSHDQKDLYLYYFLQKHPGRTIVFCNSIDCVRRLAKLFTILQCNPNALHAKMAQRARLKSLERFTKSATGLLVATDVAARGLDIPNVQHVIHYQVPRTSENYIHRSGRTARGSNEGIAILLMEPKETNDYVKLCRTLKRNEDLPIFPVVDRYLAAIRERVGLARKLDVAELHERRYQADKGWLKRSAHEMDILINDESDDSDANLYDSDNEVSAVDRSKVCRELKHMRGVLKHLIAKPIFPKGFSYRYPSTIHTDETVKTDDKNAVNVMKHAISDSQTSKKKHKFV